MTLILKNKVIIRMMNQPKLTRKEWNIITQMLTRNKKSANEARLALKSKILDSLNVTRQVHDEVTIKELN